MPANIAMPPMIGTSPTCVFLPPGLSTRPRTAMYQGRSQSIKLDAQVRMTVPPQSEPVAIQGATIHTVTSGVIENGTIVELDA